MDDNVMHHGRDASSLESDSDGIELDKQRRPSRSSRTVSNLSKEQLERKRTNDREAQRAIRKRTKEQMANLQQWVAHLTAPGEPGERIAALLKTIEDLRKENEELRKSNDMLQRRVTELDPNASLYTTSDRTGLWNGTHARPAASFASDATYVTRDSVQDVPINAQGYHRSWSSANFATGRSKPETAMSRSPQEYNGWPVDAARVPRMDNTFQRSDQSYILQRSNALPLSSDQLNGTFSSTQYGPVSQTYSAHTNNHYPPATQLPQSLPQTSILHTPQRPETQPAPHLYYASYAPQPPIE